MAFTVPENLYVIHYKPSNRKEKRSAQKEYEKIQYHVLPVVLTYLETSDKTDDLRLLARDEYMKRCTIANKGNVFVTADPFFFGRHFPTTKQVNKIIRPNNKAKYAAICITILILAFLIGIVLSKY